MKQYFSGRALTERTRLFCHFQADRQKTKAALIRSRVLATNFARVLKPVAVPQSRGSRECRAFGSPVASRAMKESTRVSHHRFAENDPAFPARWFYGFLRARPGDRAFLSPSSAQCVSIVANLISASGHQAHTTSPSARLRPFVVRPPRVHRIPHPTFVTIAKRPS